MLKLAGPMQAWGAGSRFVHRETRQEPTKSGVLGLVAAALGRRRVDPVEDLVGLRFGVRVDQPGQLLRDFQTAKTLDGSKSMPLSYRYYLADAVFVAALEGPSALLEGIDAALDDPVFPLYLGRRSCVPSAKPSLGLRDGDLESGLRGERWHAAPWYQRRQKAEFVSLELVRDAAVEETGESVRDVPVSFSPERREYLWRTVVRPAPVSMWTPNGTKGAHQPMAELGGE
ncbi:type I-E CRISPR-associated protein Cas5/CasD [Specibacter cremeus]|uniref:type I-E CRISPR-associated protein Cas5/CasD n=1 Tax=Specibacter cremeus TaxID=1629051 RepID=UPI001F0CC2C4|nr:type I-E CRISPR-associated protein Cas5/CasD [Specibacter cremeus]